MTTVAWYRTDGLSEKSATRWLRAAGAGLLAVDGRGDSPAPRVTRLPDGGLRAVAVWPAEWTGRHPVLRLWDSSGTQWYGPCRAPGREHVPSDFAIPGRYRSRLTLLGVALLALAGPRHDHPAEPGATADTVLRGRLWALAREAEVRHALDAVNRVPALRGTAATELSEALLVSRAALRGLADVERHLRMLAGRLPVAEPVA